MVSDRFIRIPGSSESILAMPDHERAMLAYVRLAELSRQKQQALGGDRFLTLAAAAACRAGWLEVAERCRDLILQDNAAHSIGRSPSAAEAMRDADFQSLIKRLERFCGYERAEHLLRELGIDPGPGDEDESVSAGRLALSILAHKPGS